MSGQGGSRATGIGVEGDSGLARADKGVGWGGGGGALVVGAVRKEIGS